MNLFSQHLSILAVQIPLRSIHDTYSILPRFDTASSSLKLFKSLPIPFPDITAVTVRSYPLSGLKSRSGNPKNAGYFTLVAWGVI